MTSEALALDVRIVGFGDEAVEYQSAWDLQRSVHAEVVAGAPDVVLLLEHPPSTPQVVAQSHASGRLMGHP